MSLDVTTLALAKSYTNQHSGGGSVPKPLTYDYMPEGYPTKAMGTITLMEEQELAFVSTEGVYAVELTPRFKVVEGQTYAVNWDGTEYECVCSSPNGKIFTLGNLSIMGMGDDTGEPFVYGNISSTNSTIVTLDTSASHTIGVKTTEEVITPMAEEFLPTNMKNTTVFYI